MVVPINNSVIKKIQLTVKALIDCGKQRLKIQILRDLLRDGAKKKKGYGWLRIEIKLNDYYAEEHNEEADKLCS